MFRVPKYLRQWCIATVGGREDSTPPPNSNLGTPWELHRTVEINMTGGPLRWNISEIIYYSSECFIAGLDT